MKGLRSSHLHFPAEPSVWGQIRFCSCHWGSWAGLLPTLPPAPECVSTEGWMLMLSQRWVHRVSLEGPAGSYPRKQALILSWGHLPSLSTCWAGHCADSFTCRIALNPYNTLRHVPASPPSLSSAFNRRGTWDAERARNWSAVTVSGMQTRGPLPHSVCSKPQGSRSRAAQPPGCTGPQPLAPVHRLRDCSGSAASAPGQVLASPWALGFSLGQ